MFVNKGWFFSVFTLKCCDVVIKRIIFVFVWMKSVLILKRPMCVFPGNFDTCTRGKPKEMRYFCREGIKNMHFAH